jgi:hypothetical protein
MTRGHSAHDNPLMIGQRHATQREFVYTHKWRVDDLVMWDNRQTMHRARPFPAHEPRDMRRTTLAGDGPTVDQVFAAPRSSQRMPDQVHAQ